MSLLAFMQELQEQDNGIIYSQAPEPTIKIIPPEKPVTQIIPPETEEKKPVTIKFKINKKTVEINNGVQTQPKEQKVQQQEVHIQKPPVQQQTQSQPIQQQVQPQVEKPQQVDTSPKELSDEEMFNLTGTEYSKKALWLEYYEQAKRSRKNNPVADRMKKGRFTITPDNKVLLLPDYDVVGKDPDDILKDKWF
jgi:hypothetical protein